MLKIGASIVCAREAASHYAYVTVHDDVQFALDHFENYDLFPYTFYERIYRAVFALHGPKWAVEHPDGLEEACEFVLLTLTDREEGVLKFRFGYDGEMYSLEETGAKYHVTRERIRAIEAKALRKLRHPERSRHLRMGGSRLPGMDRRTGKSEAALRDP